jgi:hypothetical protein
MSDPKQENSGVISVKVVEPDGSENVVELTPTPTKYLELRLMHSLHEHRTTGDGGCKSGISSLDAVIDYLSDLNPQWARVGLLNPLAEVRRCLTSIHLGIPHNILRQAPKGKRHAPAVDQNKSFYRGAVAALVDIAVEKSGISVPDGCKLVARRFRDARMPLGKTLSSDVGTLQNWRKRVSGASKDDAGKQAYSKMIEIFGGSSDPIDDVLRAALNTLRGIAPPLDTK